MNQTLTYFFGKVAEDGVVVIVWVVGTTVVPVGMSLEASRTSIALLSLEDDKVSLDMSIPDVMVEVEVDGSSKLMKGVSLQVLPETTVFLAGREGGPELKSSINSTKWQSSVAVEHVSGDSSSVFSVETE